MIAVFRDLFCNRVKFDLQLFGSNCYWNAGLIVWFIWTLVLRYCWVDFNAYDIFVIIFVKKTKSNKSNNKENNKK